MPEPWENPHEPSEHALGPGHTAPRVDDPTEGAAGPPTKPIEGDWAEGQTLDWPQGRPDDLGEKAEEPSGPGDLTTVFADDLESDPPVGTKIRYLGDYELLNLIGKGGMMWVNSR